MLQLVFDFHTASVQTNRFVPTNTDFLSTMTDHALAQLETKKREEGMEALYSAVDSSLSYFGESQLREVHHFEIEVPWYLENEKYVGNAMDIPQIVSDIGSSPNKSYPLIKVGLAVMIPQSVIDGSKSVGAIVECGHGLFLNRGMLDTTPMRRLANDNGFVVFATDLRGLSLAGLPILGKVSTADASKHIVDLYMNLIQGYVNKVAAARFYVREILDRERVLLKLPVEADFDSFTTVRDIHYYMSSVYLSFYLS